MTDITPNPTAERVIADAITAYWDDEERSGPNRGPEAHDRVCGIDAANALRAHGLLSEGAPSEEQIEQAALAGMNKYAGFLARQNHQRDPWRGIGAKCLCGKVFDLDADHAMHQVDEILRAALVAAQGAAPVLPSGGVDEEKLAEVIASATDLWDDPLDEVHDIPQIARAVAEWLEEENE